MLWITILHLFRKVDTYVHDLVIRWRDMSELVSVLDQHFLLIVALTFAAL